VRIAPFQLERWQSLHEHDVELNLSDSGVHPLRLSELVDDPTERAAMLDMELGYTQTDGTRPLRVAISEIYGAQPEQVLVTTGGVEANFLSIWHLVEPDDEVIVMLPNYMQVWGAAEAMGARCRAWRMQPDFERARWTADLDLLEALVNSRTKLIAVCHPNNPTGATWDDAWCDRLAAIAQSVGAWVLSDEIYQGSELDGRGATPTMWGRLDRVLVTNSLSKAYGLPGLRLGWIVAQKNVRHRLWSHKDYTSIAPSPLSDRLATIALQSTRRAELLRRTHHRLVHNCGTVMQWIDAHSSAMRAITPAAGAMLFVQYHHDINSSELAERMRREMSVLLVPGDHYGMDGWLRIGFGGEAQTVERGLYRLHDLLASL
jgi:aspartate/methionine/tyrosine aminotransferase